MATLIAVPGTAVCWNFIPKDLFQEKVPVSATLKPEVGDEYAAEPPPPSFLPEAEKKKERFALFETPEAAPLPRPSVQSASMNGNDAIRRMDYRNADGTEVTPIPTSFPAGFPAPAIASAEFDGKIAGAYEPSTPTNRFAGLEAELQRLGARHTRFEAWGAGGGLYRFSCYVSASQPYRYQKHFQSIDADQLRAMETVIEEIRAWRQTSGTTGPGS